MSLWAFIDCENVNEFEHLNLDIYERILLFCGPRNKKLNIDSLSDLGFHHLEILKVSSTGKNNLDFHIAFHLGCLHREVKTNVAFHIISKDKGYDGLIQHLNTLKRHCKRVEPAPKLSQDGQRIISLLEKTPETNRPSTEKKLTSWIEDKFKNRKAAPKPENLINKFRAANLIKITEGKVTYQFEKTAS